MTMKQVLLAPSKLFDPDKHTSWPVLVSTKLDGNRALFLNGKIFTRSMKEQPNRHLYTRFSDLVKFTKDNPGVAIDGELYDHTIPFSDLQSILRSKDAEPTPHLMFYAFDYIEKWGTPDRDFASRQASLQRSLQHTGVVRCLRQTMLHTPSEVQAVYEEALNFGYEGLMVRNPSAPYKYGRATTKEDIIHKMKPWITDDAVVIGVEPMRRLRNGLDRGKNEIGRTKKTYKQDDFVEVDEIGSLIVRDEKGREFSLGWGRGWDAVKKAGVWKDHKKSADVVGRWVEYRSMGVGEKDLPRMPQLIRFRDDKE